MTTPPTSCLEFMSLDTKHFLFPKSGLLVSYKTLLFICLGLIVLFLEPSFFYFSEFIVRLISTKRRRKHFSPPVIIRNIIKLDPSVIFLQDLISKAAGMSSGTKWRSAPTNRLYLFFSLFLFNRLPDGTYSGFLP